MLPPFAASAEESGKPEDLLRFRNGDSLHGAFLGLSDGDLRWRHSEARDTITLKTQKLRPNCALLPLRN